RHQAGDRSLGAQGARGIQGARGAQSDSKRRTPNRAPEPLDPSPCPNPMHEPDVTITDFLLAIEALAFAVLLARSSTTTTPQWFVSFSGARAVASLAGGLVHGFFSDNKVLWRVVLIALGIVSAAAWAIGADLLFSDRTARLVASTAWVAFAAYAFVVIFVT